jgi:hypothetical protein
VTGGASPVLAIVARAFAGGATLGLSFNPLAAVAGSVVAAVVGTLVARRDGHASPVWWVVIAALAWLVGDGLAVAGAAAALLRTGNGLLGNAAPAWAAWLLLTVWAAVGLGVGYLLPAGTGVAVGRRVHFGTGWLAAGAVALAAALAVVVIAETAASLLSPLLRA